MVVDDGKSNDRDAKRLKKKNKISAWKMIRQELENQGNNETSVYTCVIDPIHNSG